MLQWHSAVQVGDMLATEVCVADRSMSRMTIILSFARKCRAKSFTAVRRMLFWMSRTYTNKSCSAIIGGE